MHKHHHITIFYVEITSCFMEIATLSMAPKKGKSYINKERCYVHNIFTTNHRWLVVTGSNLNLTLRLLFCLNNNNQ